MCLCSEQLLACFMTVHLSNCRLAQEEGLQRLPHHPHSHRRLPTHRCRRPGHHLWTSLQEEASPLLLQVAALLSPFFPLIQNGKQ